MSEGSSALWERVERVLPRVERPSRYVNSEWGAVRDRPAEHRTLLAYPDTYEIGQANQGLAILYGRLNAEEGFCAERTYVPWVDMATEMRAAALPLFSLESTTPAVEFDVLGITLPYELTYTNVLELLDLAHIPFRAADRDERYPLVIGGGPCVFNPEPIALFFDALFIGEAEEGILDVVRAHRDAMRAGCSREETLDQLACVPGVYVPARYGVAGGKTPAARASVPPSVVRRVLRDFDGTPPALSPVVPFMDVVHDRVAVEIARGCARGCRFCQAGMIYRPPRERSADSVVQAALCGLAATGFDEVSLTSLSTTDHGELHEILHRLLARFESSERSISLPSLRADAFGVKMATLASSGRAPSGLTLAPEAGTQRMRDVINKNVEEEQLIDAIVYAASSGWRRVKLYFMIGLPFETDDDVVGIGRLVSRARSAVREALPPAERGSFRLAVSVSNFVPKAHTPFQWCGQVPQGEILRRQELLRGSMPRKGVELSWHDAGQSLIEGVLARGGRELSDGIELAWRRGLAFSAWTERFNADAWLRAFEASGVDPHHLAERSWSVEDRLPWDHICTGVSRAYLWSEFVRAANRVRTDDCTVAGCTGCGVCGSLSVLPVVGGGRRVAR